MRATPEKTKNIFIGGLMIIARIVLLFCLVFAIHTVHADTTLLTDLSKGQSGKLLFKSVDRKTNLGHLVSRTFQLTETISADLLLPEGQGPFPAMVIAHGSGGLNATHYAWAEYFRAKGMAAFLVDSFKERGIVDTVSDQNQLTYVASATDQLVALRLLVTHPQIDAKRIGIIGFSRGGSATVGAAIEKWRAAVAGNARYALHLPFYGGCGWIADRWTGAPIHQFIGDSDDYIQPVATCEAQLKKLQAAGISSSLNVFPGARHSFDNLNVRKDYYLGRAVTWAKCSYLLNVDSRRFHVPADSNTTRPERELAAVMKDCMSYGTTLGPNAKATASAKAIIDKILMETLLK